jgi:hypothetical protein
MTNEREPAEETEAVADLPAQNVEEVSVEYLPEAPDGPAGREIHERGRLPAVPEGPDVPDPNPSPPADIKSGRC